ncbi:hypothetical protein DFH11DRAFT_1834119 [Phellopilus nigrolimitatus]|nr:hypothetical protein DFH11DRAFT_1834119 [Phellopilus nigrolimitatus]
MSPLYATGALTNCRWINDLLTIIPRVVTCVKIKYVQQPMGKRAGTNTVIRPSKCIIYDVREAIVSFLSKNVDTCVDVFLEEWAKVSKMVVIACEVAQMAKQNSWEDVLLLSFDLRRFWDYTVYITCTDQLMLSSNRSYELSFYRIRTGKPWAALDVMWRNSESGRDNDAHAIGVNFFPKAEGWYRVLYGDSRSSFNEGPTSGHSRCWTLIDAGPVVVHFASLAATLVFTPISTTGGGTATCGSSHSLHMAQLQLISEKKQATDRNHAALKI